MADVGRADADAGEKAGAGVGGEDPIAYVVSFCPWTLRDADAGGELESLAGFLSGTYVQLGVCNGRESFNCPARGTYLYWSEAIPNGWWSTTTGWCLGRELDDGNFQAHALVEPGSAVPEGEGAWKATGRSADLPIGVAMQTNAQVYPETSDPSSSTPPISMEQADPLVTSSGACEAEAVASGDVSRSPACSTDSTKADRCAIKQELASSTQTQVISYLLGAGSCLQGCAEYVFLVCLQVAESEKEKKVEETRTDPKPGHYVVIHEKGIPIHVDTSRSSAVTATLERGTKIHVLEIAEKTEHGRVRGRIESPPGWISLACDGHIFVNEADEPLPASPEGEQLCVNVGELVVDWVAVAPPRPSKEASQPEATPEMDPGLPADVADATGEESVLKDWDWVDVAAAKDRTPRPIAVASAEAAATAAEWGVASPREAEPVNDALASCVGLPAPLPGEGVRRIVAAYGPPGCGKDIVLSRLAEEMDVPVLTVGDLVREAVASGTGAGQLVRVAVECGIDPSDEMILDVLQERISEADCRAGFVMDCLPRSWQQAHALDARLAQQEDGISVVLSFEVDKRTLEQWVCGRWVHEASGRSYHVLTSPPASMPVSDGTAPLIVDPTAMLDDVTGEQLTQPPDCFPKVFRSRLEAHDAQFLPILSYYSSRDIVKIINTSVSPEEVWAEVQQYL